VVAVGGVVSTKAAEDDLSGRFFDDFATALANHQGMGAGNRLRSGLTWSP
jgi:hypothetical protein